VVRGYQTDQTNQSEVADREMDRMLSKDCCERACQNYKAIQFRDLLHYNKHNEHHNNYENPNIISSVVIIFKKNSDINCQEEYSQKR